MFGEGFTATVGYLAQTLDKVGVCVQCDEFSDPLIVREAQYFLIIELDRSQLVHILLDSLLDLLDILVNDPWPLLQLDISSTHITLALGPLSMRCATAILQLFSLLTFFLLLELLLLNLKLSQPQSFDLLLVFDLLITITPEKKSYQANDRDPT